MLYDLCIASSILSFHTFLCLLCSWLWILCAPLGLQNLTPGTPRFTHFYASLRSFKSGSLGIPGLIIYSIDITCSMLAGNGLGKYNLVIGDSLYLTVGFIRPSGFKTLRQELPDSHIFMRHFVPSKMVHWGSQALSFTP